MNVTKIVLNPVRLRIIQFLAIHNNSTVFQISNKISDIPKTTLYRHINILEQNNIIKVVSENRIRGTVEKVYSLNNEPPVDSSPADLSASFLLDLLGKVSNYFENKEN
ncbi:MAG: helix-turn-helix domain-containing protein, partial [Oscillospiraceae bacterium]